MDITKNKLNLLYSKIKPSGWMTEQLIAQAKGLTGNLHKFWPDIRDSKWIGGNCEGWERVPYWLDGLIPLAMLLDDAELKADAKYYVDAILERQHADGWLCPCEDGERGRYDAWAALLILKVLTVYADCLGDPDGKVQNAVYRALRQLNRHLDVHPLFGWAQMRWYEGLISAYWLFRKTNEQWLVEVILKLKCQGFDYFEFYKKWPYKKPSNEWGQLDHIVNNVMAVKSGGLYSQFSGAKSDYRNSKYMLDKMTRFHGMVTGAITGDECFSGLSPIQGSELCSIAELMYSLEILTQISGGGEWFDRLESLTFNCLPASITPDMWAHQYDQQVNQVQCVRSEKPVFRTNGGESNLYGLEPNFGCCTANFNQAWPKFAMSTVMEGEDGLYVLSYVPVKVDGEGYLLTVDSDYPFRESAIIRIDAKKEMTLKLRVPDWCVDFTVGGHRQDIADGFVCIKVDKGINELTVSLPSEVRFVSRPNNMFAVKKGALVYSLKINEEFTQVNKEIEGREFPHCDYEVRPLDAWNYGFFSKEFKIQENAFSGVPFSPDNAPVTITIPCAKIKWNIKRGSVTKLPVSTSPISNPEQKSFIPYGCTNIRLTELPFIK